MRSALPLATFALLALSVPAAGAQGQPGNATGVNVSGFYRNDQINQAGACEPQPLPAPAPASPSDTGWYFPAAALAADTIVFWGRFTQTGTGLTLSVSDSTGRNAGPPFTGTVQPDGSFTIGRRMLRLEGGPRQGGHRFFVVQEFRATGKFEPRGDRMGWSGSGAFAHQFRSDSATGAVFTTCSRPATATGTRVSP